VFAFLIVSSILLGQGGAEQGAGGRLVAGRVSTAQEGSPCCPNIFCASAVLLKLPKAAHIFNHFFCKIVLQKSPKHRSWYFNNELL